MREVSEDFLTLYCDPGEDFGWAVGHGLTLAAAGTEKMWPFADQIHDKLTNPTGSESAVESLDGFDYTIPNPLSSDTHLRDGVDPEVMKLPLGRVVCEDFKLYPWELQNMAWDPVRTARVIGAITFMCRLFTVPLVFQPAAIKKAAVAAGAEELFYRPLTENRHQNDAIMHYVWYTNTELLEIPLELGKQSPPPA